MGPSSPCKVTPSAATDQPKTRYATGSWPNSWQFGELVTSLRRHPLNSRGKSAFSGHLRLILGRVIRPCSSAMAVRSRLRRGCRPPHDTGHQFHDERPSDGKGFMNDALDKSRFILVLPAIKTCHVYLPLEMLPQGALTLAGAPLLLVEGALFRRRNSRYRGKAASCRRRQGHQGMSARPNAWINAVANVLADQRHHSRHGASRLIRPLLEVLSFRERLRGRIRRCVVARRVR